MRHINMPMDHHHPDKIGTGQEFSHTINIDNGHSGESSINTVSNQLNNSLFFSEKKPQ